MPTDEGYPTEEELEGLRTFEGTWREYMAYIKSIGNYWADNSFGWSEHKIMNGGMAPDMLYKISTGGWSGNEEIISVLENEPLWFMWWDSSTRGGHFEFRIPFTMLDAPAWHLDMKEVGNA